ncbi:hypothetical protein FJT64_013399 [Amphibalanus amphitrite]|uniref:Uncharacterized protein n=1 Tax=Amphibalanus amphitrite TaxID=1232801 RepID=A0A6A4UWW8_AMPAM|nr:hypothetical protein FJT64_013399 [Amphibalanus amphitrite]
MSDRELSRKIQLKSLEEEVSMNTVITMMRNVEIRLVEISRAQQADELLQRVVQQTLSGWKEGAKHSDMLDYFAARGEISVLYLTSGTLLMYGRRIIIPPSLREEMLNRLHDDGPGTARNRATGSTSATSGGAADIRGSTTPGGDATTTTAASASCAVA